MRRAIVVVGKAPLAGRTKTRLVPPLSGEDAAELYRAFLLDTLERALSLGWERTTLVHPRGHATELRQLVPPNVRLLEQPRDGLSDALAYAFAQHFEEGCARVTLIGSDNPTLPAAPALASDAALEDGADLTIGPTVDGGYYLIGMRQPWLGVFENVDWSTSRVYSQTLQRAEALRLRVQQLEEWYDVDEPADLDRLRGELARNPSGVAQHTRATLEWQRSINQTGGTSNVGARPERSA
jgi:rSAM/selenodomain-associated transferase 1